MKFHQHIVPPLVIDIVHKQSMGVYLGGNLAGVLIQGNEALACLFEN